MATAPAPFGARGLATELGADLQHTIDADSPSNNHANDTKASTASSVTAGKVSDPTDSDYDDNGMTKHQEQEIGHLARQMSRRSSVYPQENLVNPFLDADADPELNPNSNEFKVSKWLKTMLHIKSRDPDRFPKRTAGVTFRNLNVYGYGTAADYQADVGNTILKGIGAIKSLLGFGKKVRIDILRNFEGIVKSGEMLIVLGRPGR